MAETDVKPERIAGERGATGVAMANGHNWLIVQLGALGIGVIVMLYVMFVMPKKPTMAVTKGNDKVTIKQNADFVPVVFPAAPAATPAKIDNGPYRETAEKADPLVDASRRAPVVAWQKRVAMPSGAAGGGLVPPPGYENGGARQDDAFEKMFKPTILEGSRAGVISNPDFVIATGTMVPCVLDTAMASDQPGLVACTISHDVLGLTGRVVLMEKGTQVVGQYKGGLKQGQRRLFVLWTRARTPQHVVVTLASPGVDSLGRSGFDGEVDNHWWERFGSALLLSIVSDATAYGAAALRDHTGVSANSTARAPNTAASIAVEQGGAIQPTLHKNQGEMVAIMLARDLDFTGIYQLRLQQRSVENGWVPPEERGSGTAGRHARSSTGDGIKD